ncbi:hypothetical protein H310_03925 [Aphanomyces invadans]|uniref:Inhibitor I9 domain-containing protein n=1 Tax=Aphanomyces invadans TaxID=157072 RepID=A0A024UEF7_9STRA|nr:hypothetical protein H310_03925 [Aphanomyces invadans]ETW04786.1 hypothetical protein H310_03925 [Aphanomyces invadans]RHY30180.1 hypothetical protein DYB32_004575 [Aphanomyces invadans]|eukprot:XP_008866224.1 hypothetical protein H310_03925 [Aphanomyces invadans]
MRFTPALIFMAAACSHAAASLDRGSPKVSLELQRAFETNEYVDIIVDMDQSTEQVEAVAGEPTDSFVEKLQAFTEVQQKPVKDLLNTHPNLFHGTPTFFWITDSIAIPQASAELVSQLAAMDGVKSIHAPEIAHIDGGGPN